MQIGEVGLFTNDVRGLASFYKSVLCIDNNSDDEPELAFITC